MLPFFFSPLLSICSLDVQKFVVTVGGEHGPRVPYCLVGVLSWKSSDIGAQVVQTPAGTRKVYL